MKKIILASAAVAAMSFGSGAMAAPVTNTCDGTGTALGSAGNPTGGGDATCVTNVTLDVNEQVVIKGLADLSMGAYDPLGKDASASGTAAATQDFCIGAIGVDSASITFDSAGTTGFQMKGDNTATDEHTYTVYFDNGLGTLASVAENTPITVQAAQLDNISCDLAGTTATQVLAVGYAAKAFDDAEDTDYTDTITVTVKPL